MFFKTQVQLILSLCLQAQCDKCEIWIHADCDKLTNKKLKVIDMLTFSSCIGPRCWLRSRVLLQEFNLMSLPLYTSWNCSFWGPASEAEWFWLVTGWVAIYRNLQMGVHTSVLNAGSFKAYQKSTKHLRSMYLLISLKLAFACGYYWNANQLFDW